MKLPNEVVFPTEVIAPDRLALVVTFPAVNPEAVPVRFVATPDEGVPKAGLTKVGVFKVGDVPSTKAPEPVGDVTPAK